MTTNADAVRASEYAGWERAAAHYNDAFADATMRFLPALLDAAAVATDKRVLDVACGPGCATAAAAARGAKARGLDFSPTMLAIARTQLPDLEFTQGDAEALPYADACFDCVVSNFGVHHFPDPARALSEAHRVLVTGGQVGFTTWAAPEDNIAWRLVFDAVGAHGDLGATKHMPPGGRLNTREACMNALAAASFADPQVELRRELWPLSRPEELIERLQEATTRMAGLIAAQDPTVLPRIAADVARQAERYRKGNRILMPIAALVASAVKA
jgi:ubiquinone/menaquinone biosynthesis C-methylase UbiE